MTFKRILFHLRVQFRAKLYYWSIKKVIKAYRSKWRFYRAQESRRKNVNIEESLFFYNNLIIIDLFFYSKDVKKAICNLIFLNTYCVLLLGKGLPKNRQLFWRFPTTPQTHRDNSANAFSAGPLASPSILWHPRTTFAHFSGSINKKIL